MCGAMGYAGTLIKNPAGCTHFLFMSLVYPNVKTLNSGNIASSPLKKCAPCSFPTQI